MQYKDITLAALKKYRPDLVSKIITESRSTSQRASESAKTEVITIRESGTVVRETTPPRPTVKKQPNMQRKQETIEDILESAFDFLTPEQRKIAAKGRR